MRLRWPFVLRRNFDALQTENFVLRDALREANAELRRHRLLIGGLREQRADVVREVERVLSKPVEA